MAGSGGCFSNESFVVRRTYVDVNGSRVVNFMKSVIEGLYILRRDRSFGLQLINRYLRVDDEMAGIG
jgi:hypothetical protein